MSTPASGIELYTDHRKSASIDELWREGLAPLLIDQFAIYLYIAPLALALLDSTPFKSDSNTITTIIILVMVFTLNLVVSRYGEYFHFRTTIRESPLFRAVWVCLHIRCISPHTGSGVVCFTIVTFLPLIYVRVLELLPSMVALYTSFVFAATVVQAVVFPTTVTVPAASEISQTSTTAMKWVLLAFGIVYHALWSSAHRHTSDPFSQPVLSYLFVRWRNSSIPTALSRTITSLLFILLRETYVGSKYGGGSQYHYAVYFVRVLFLLATSSTFLAWAHCQHSHRSTLSSILAVSVVASTCGIIVDTVEQSLCLCVVTFIAIYFDIAYIHKTDHTKAD